MKNRREYLALKTKRSKVVYSKSNISSSDLIFLNGLLQREGESDDYTFKRNRIKLTNIDNTSIVTVVR